MNAKRNLATRLIDAAETDLALPYSLVLDAWDRALAEGMSDATRTQWLACLTDAVDAFEAEPTTYWKRDRIYRVTGTPEWSDE